MLAIGIPSISAQSSQRRKIRHVEHYQTGSQSFRNEKLPAKTKRKSSDKGNIVLYYDADLPDSVKIAFELAKDIWEAKLQNKYPINIEMKFYDLGDDIAMVTEALYDEMDNSICYPTSLVTNLNGKINGIENGADGYVTFNSEMDWNCNFTTVEASSYNLTTMAMRGIARCLGFGSTLVDRGQNKFEFYFVFPSLFDCMLYSPNSKLIDFDQESEQMANFVQSNQIYLDTKTKTYSIYAPTKFEQDRSLCCLTENGSLMSANLGAGSTFLSIDDATIDILKSIGWEFPEVNSRIICDDISDDGIGSAYSSHIFSVADNQTNISAYNWKFYLKKKDGSEVLISTASTKSFKIEKINNPQDYLVNIDGDLQGRIECEYTQNGKQFTAIPFSLSLELKPVINSIDNIQINWSDYSFSLKFDVNYVGAAQIDVEVEEEFGSAVRLYSFYEPFYAHAKTGNINALYYSWVTVIAENEYGTTYETMDFPPAYNPSNITTSVDEIEIMSRPVKIQLISIDGNIIYEGEDTSLSNISKGLYIKKEYYEDGSTTTNKIIMP